MQSVNKPGLIDAKNKRLLAIALAIAQRCDECLDIHLEAAISEGLSVQEIDEAAWMAISFCGAPANLFYKRAKMDLKLD